jgi:hypothetical protein
VADGIGANFAPLAPEAVYPCFHCFLVLLLAISAHLFNGLPSRALLSRQRSIFRMDDCLNVKSLLRAIAVAKKKNDQIDASKIADCPRCDFLPECHMMPAEIRDRRRALRYRICWCGRWCR